MTNNIMLFIRNSLLVRAFYAAWKMSGFELELDFDKNECAQRPWAQLDCPNHPQ
jgi:hypothetical protein